MRPPERHSPRAGTDRLVRRGLAGLRHAEPDPGVWDRIASELGPGPGSQPRPRWRLNLPMATLAGAMCLAVMALGGLNLGLGSLAPGHFLEAVAPEVANQQLDEELAELMTPRAVDLSLPAVALSLSILTGWEPDGWHYPQVSFNANEWPARATVLYGGASPAIDARLQ